MIEEDIEGGALEMLLVAEPQAPLFRERVLPIMTR